MDTFQMLSASFGQKQFHKMGPRIENLYSRFKMLLLNRDDSSKLKVTQTLQRIDQALKAGGHRFLTGSTIAFLQVDDIIEGLLHLHVPT
jgi:hypothetical protein